MSQAISTVNMDDRVRVDAETNTVWSNRTLRESGGSVVVTLPRQVVEAAQLDIGEQVTIAAHLSDGEIRISKAQTRD